MPRDELSFPCKDRSFVLLSTLYTRLGSKAVKDNSFNVYHNRAHESGEVFSRALFFFIHLVFFIKKCGRVFLNPAHTKQIN